MKFMTYYISNDYEGKLRKAARTSCDIWNRFILPSEYIVVQLDCFYEESYTIARAYQPFSFGFIRYGLVEFNELYLHMFTHREIVRSIFHENGHILGMGFGRWMDLFYQDTGAFTPEAIGEVSQLQHMFVETDYGPGTELAHWDEGRFTTEIMTGLQNEKETMLPVTIEVMSLLGHKIKESLTTVEEFDYLISLSEDYYQFSRKKKARKLNKEYKQITPLHEELIYTPKRKK